MHSTSGGAGYGVPFLGVASSTCLQRGAADSIDTDYRARRTDLRLGDAVVRSGWARRVWGGHRRSRCSSRLFYRHRREHWSACCEALAMTHGIAGTAMRGASRTAAVVAGMRRGIGTQIREHSRLRLDGPSPAHDGTSSHFLQLYNQRLLFVVAASRPVAGGRRGGTDDRLPIGWRCAGPGARDIRLANRVPELRTRDGARDPGALPTRNVWGNRDVIDPSMGSGSGACARTLLSASIDDRTVAAPAASRSQDISGRRC